MGSQRLIEFPDFKSLLNKLNVPIAIKPNAEREELMGGANKVYFQNIPVNKTVNKIGNKNPNIRDETKSIANLRIVITKERRNNFDLLTENSISLLRKASQPPPRTNGNNFEEKPSPKLELLNCPFIQPILAYGNKSKITEEEIADLDRFKNHKLYSRDDIDYKEIFAQMLLALWALHSRNLVHRDPSLKNFFVKSVNNPSLHVMLSDLDSVIYANQQDVGMIGPEAKLSPPEFNKVWEIEDNKARFNAYNSISNKKAIDCFIIGKDFEKFYREYIGNCEFMPNELKNLIARLTDDNPSKRLTIAQAIQHNFFGTDETRQDFFKNLNEKFKQPPDVYFDDFYCGRANRYPEVNDYFYILPKKHKEIYLTASTLQNQINSLSQIEDRDDQINSSSEIKNKNQTNSSSKVNNENDQYINNYDELSVICKTSMHLFRLANTATPQTDLIKQFKKSALDTYNAIPFKIKMNMAKHITPNQLLTMVRTACDTYIAINGLKELNTPRLFERWHAHGLFGKNQAIAFKNRIKEMVDEGKSSYDIYCELNKHLKNGSGRSGKTSFKTILIQEFSDISWFPHKVLLENLSRQPPDLQPTKKELDTLYHHILRY